MAFDPKKIPVSYATLQSSVAFPRFQIPEVSQISNAKTPTLRAFLTPQGLWIERNEVAVGLIPTTNIKMMEFRTDAEGSDK